jgi:hypothetical protein
MKISNDYRILDQEFQRIIDVMKDLSQVNENLSKELDALHNSGFKDIKFENLRKVVNESIADLKETHTFLNKKSAELNGYSAIIKEYYSVAI